MARWPRGLSPGRSLNLSFQSRDVGLSLLFPLQCNAKKKKKANKGVLSPFAAACVCAPLSDVAAIGKSQ